MGDKGFDRLYKSTVYSIKGLKRAFQNEAAFRQELILIAVLFPISILVAESFVVWVILITPMFLLLITELLNSSIEAAVDRVGIDYNYLSERAKDIASAAVFINLVFLAIVWIVYLLRYWEIIIFL